MRGCAYPTRPGETPTHATRQPRTWEAPHGATSCRLVPQPRRSALTAAVVAAAVVAATIVAAASVHATPGWAQQQPEARPSATDVRGDPLVRWHFFAPLPLPGQIESPWVDAILGPRVFHDAQEDLDDLRLLDRTGHEVPFALRVLAPKQQSEEIQASVFNRAEGPDGSRELSLDLGAEPIEHNQVQVGLPGVNYRRRAMLEGSDDRSQWRELADEYLIHFRREDHELHDVAIDYPASRFRYLRLRVEPDPALDDKPLELGQVTVAKRVDVPGEMLRLTPTLDSRQPVQESNTPASAWLIDLGSDNVPCSRLEVEIAEDQFVRDYRIERVLPPEEVRLIVGSPFQEVARGVWQRRPDDPRKPMVAEMPEVKASRLRLVVLDYGNPPLGVQSLAVLAPARQIVLARPEDPDPGLRLYFGNPQADAPHYDFQRNLSDVLNPPPARPSWKSRRKTRSTCPCRRP